MIKYGLNEFKNSKDNTTQVIINDGLLREVGVPKGDVNDKFTKIYILDAVGNKVEVEFADALNQSIANMDDAFKNEFLNNIFGSITIKPSEISAISPCYTMDSGKQEFILHGNNMNVTETDELKLILFDPVDNSEIISDNWYVIDAFNIKAIFDIPETKKGSTLKPVFKTGNVMSKSSAELNVFDGVFEPLVFKYQYKTGETTDFKAIGKKVTLKPLYENDVMGDAVEILTSEIPNTDFIITMDLGFSTKDGINQNYISYNKTGVGICTVDNIIDGVSKMDDIFFEIVNFKPSFSTDSVKNIKSIKFIKKGNSLYKIMITDKNIHTTQKILITNQPIRLAFTSQKLDALCQIKELNFNNINIYVKQ